MDTRPLRNDTDNLKNDYWIDHFRNTLKDLLEKETETLDEINLWEIQMTASTATLTALLRKKKEYNDNRNKR